MGVAIVAANWAVVVYLGEVMAAHEVRSAPFDVGLVLFGVAASLLLFPAIKAVLTAGRARAAAAEQDVIAARVHGTAARTWCWYTFGYAAAIVIILLMALLIVANDVAVGRTFFYLPLMYDSFWLVLRAFWVNVYICVIAEVLVLIWGLAVAIARLLPGKPARPVRLIATAYADVFRGLPAIITIYLVAFGLALAGLPIVRDLPLSSLAIFALTLTYGAYVAEVYRAGIESIHWSQTAAARSLGLSFLQTLRFVVVPQAVRRIIPPLLNDFIGLQKDTALVQVVGIIDAFNQSKIVASNKFNLSAVTTVGILFVLFTIPQTRFVDRLLARERRRTQAGG
ncbi:MAG TPA: amino acid ABC transporter permease [Dongiaceae bacterium]|nr:amino acid ABC transporter permease [Dongiaceae bacterium]